MTGDSKVCFSEQEHTTESSRRRIHKKSKDAAQEFYAALVVPEQSEGVQAATSKLLKLAKEAKEAADAQKNNAAMQSRGVYSQVYFRWGPSNMSSTVERISDSAIPRGRQRLLGACKGP